MCKRLPHPFWNGCLYIHQFNVFLASIRRSHAHKCSPLGSQSQISIPGWDHLRLTRTWLPLTVCCETEALFLHNMTKATFKHFSLFHLFKNLNSIMYVDIYISCCFMFCFRLQTTNNRKSKLKDFFLDLANVRQVL